MRHTTFQWAMACALLITAFLPSCKHKAPENNEIPKDEHEILNEDSLELVQAYRAQDKITATLQAVAETEPVDAKSNEDAADDPAIWVNSANPDRSVVFGSNKKGGLVATDLEGNNIKYYPLGSINNVDITYSFAREDSTITLLGCSNRSTQSINIFEISENGKLKAFDDPTFKMDTTRVDDIYGFCFGYDNEGKEHYAFINGKNGLMQQYLIQASTDNRIKLQLEREVQFESQTEGMVVDYKRGNLYVGEEGRGVWMLDIDPKSTEKTFIDLSDHKNENIRYDIEGLTLYDDGEYALLFASSQGNFSYAVFDVSSNNKYLGSFKISDNNIIDGVEETDGIDIVSDSLSTDYPNGIFVAQDGFNYDNDTIVAQNFKYINTRDILKLVDAFVQPEQ